MLASHVPSTGNLAWNSGMCPDWELNLQPFGSQAGTQFTEPQQPGLGKKILNKLFYFLGKYTFNLLTLSRREIWDSAENQGLTLYLHLDVTLSNSSLNYRIFLIP